MAPLLLLLVLLLAGVDTTLASCRNTTCAGLNISYPFWLINSPGSHCGYPGLGLVCDNNHSLILDVQSHRYRVRDIYYSNHIIAVSDADAGDDEYESAGCPRLHWNVTIDYTSSWLQLAPSDTNITFLYNCKKNISSSYAVELSACRRGYDGNRSYVLTDGLATGSVAYEHECEKLVVAPVLNDHWKGIIDGGPPPVNGSYSYDEVVKAGFEFVYRPNSERCGRCERSGGWCGYQHNESANGEMGFTCFCNDGPTSERCGSAALHSASVHHHPGKWTDGLEQQTTEAFTRNIFQGEISYLELGSVQDRQGWSCGVSGTGGTSFSV